MPSQDFSFRLDAVDRASAARAGTLATPHGCVPTPTFMPVGSRAAVKAVPPDALRACDVPILLANTYHLALRPGPDAVEQLGGLHRFMGWDRPILTDSGGFQIFSLAPSVKIAEEGARLRSPLDGSELLLTPESSIAIQEALGADIIMCLDICLPRSATLAQHEEAVARTTRWAERCARVKRRDDQALFGIVQGGLHPDLRRASAAALVPLNLPGYAIGGLSVGEGRTEMFGALEFTLPLLPADRPRYLMGVGYPADIVGAVLRGVDMVDCVAPTRNARNAMAFTREGPVRLRNLAHRTDRGPLERDCPCVTCRQFSRGYLRHLFQVGETLGGTLVSIHNIAFLTRLMRELREAIVAGEAVEFAAGILARWGGGG